MTKINSLILAGLIPVGIAMTGCSAPPKVSATVAAAHGQATPEAQLDFWHSLAEAPVTSNDDAFHGLLLTLDGTSADSYEARVEALKSKGLLPAGFSAPADQAITRGVLSVALAKHLGMRGGVMNFVTGGNTKRYSTRELVAEGILPPSTPNQTLSGAEFVGVMGAVEDYVRGGPDAITGSIAPVTQAEPAAPARSENPDETPSSIQRQIP